MNQEFRQSAVGRWFFVDAAGHKLTHIVMHFSFNDR